MRQLIAGFIAVSGLALTGCGYNTIQTQDEAVKAAWSEVVNQYQRSADLIPNLVNTVKGFAAQEQAVLIGLFAYGLALVLSTLLFRFFPRNVVLLPEDLVLVFGGLLVACVLGSWIGIARAMRVRAKEVLA